MRNFADDTKYATIINKIERKDENETNDFRIGSGSLCHCGYVMWR